VFTFLSRLKLLFTRIQSGQEAADFLGEVVTMFIVIAAIQAAVGLLILGDKYFLIDAGVYAGLATWIYLAQSTIAAVLLVLVRAIVLVIAFKLVSETGFGIQGAMFALITLGLSVRTVEATIKLKKAKAELGASSSGGGRPSAVIETGGDVEALQGLKKAGSNLGKPHDAEFFLHFPTEAAAQEAVGKVKAMGLETAEVRTGDKPGEWIVYSRKSMKLDAEGLKRMRYHFGRIAKAGGGRYGGWEAAIVK